MTGDLCSQPIPLDYGRRQITRENVFSVVVHSTRLARVTVNTLTRIVRNHRDFSSRLRLVENAFEFLLNDDENAEPALDFLLASSTSFDDSRSSGRSNHGAFVSRSIHRRSAKESSTGRYSIGTVHVQRGLHGIWCDPTGSSPGDSLRSILISVTFQMPKRYPLGIVKVLLITIPFLYLGSLVSKYAALGLEKMDLFVYSEDDDDDDDDD